jgi:hypothetical protein
MGHATLIHVDVVDTRAGELIEMLGPSIAVDVWLQNLGSKESVRAALIEGEHFPVLVAAASGEFLDIREDIFPYHAWHNEQSEINFWQAAFSWTLYWRTVLMGEYGDPCWMDRIVTPVATSPMFGFLDISCGRFTWDFQIELAHRLVDGDVTRAVKFRKEWNARNGEAMEVAQSQRLPGGMSLIEALESHAPYGYPIDATVVAVPVRAAHALLKPPQSARDSRSPPLAPLHGVCGDSIVQ